ncbi:MAG: class I SAM-dependent methyltransferase [Candidatus Rokubacteria bacterium]|nr:class I SAM-dependent methyltransferase [Candidatus Rokubacteria bacterium]
MASGAESSDPAGAAGISPAFRALLDAEPLAGLTVLDVGTGWGRLALLLAPRSGRVVGVDREAGLIEEARRRASSAGVANVRFVVGDVEVEELVPFRPDAVVAHLCMSDAIIERAARALAPGRMFAFVAFHRDQWRETGRRSRFAYDEAQARRALARAAFAVEHLQVEREVRAFASVEEGLAAAGAFEEKWKAEGRWSRYVKFLEEGGRTLTRSHLVVKARRT